MQRSIQSAILAAGLATGLATAAAAQTAPSTYPYQAAPASAYDYGVPEQRAALPPGTFTPAQIAPAPNDVWHELNNERSRQEQRIGGGG